jgi:hypothetical protein
LSRKKFVAGSVSRWVRKFQLRRRGVRKKYITKLVLSKKLRGRALLTIL